MKQQNVIRKFDNWKDAVAEHEEFECMLVVGYKPTACPGFVNGTVYATVMSVNDSTHGRSFVDLDMSGIEIDFTDIVEWIIVYPTEEQLAARAKMEESWQRYLKSDEFKIKMGFKTAA